MTYAVLRRELADTLGSLEKWPVIELELEDATIEFVETEAERYGCDFDTLVNAIICKMLVETPEE